MATVTWTIDQVRRRLLPDEDVGEWSDATGASPWSTGRCPTPGPAGRWASSKSPGALSVVAVTRAGAPRLDARELVGQEGDVLHLAVLDDALRRARLDAARRRRHGRRRPAR